MTPAQHWAFTKVSLAKQFGWELDYIDNLSQAELQTIFASLGGINKYNEDENRKRQSRAAAARPGRRGRRR